MNKIAPVDYEPSAISIINIPYAHSVAKSQTMPRICKICLDEEVVNDQELMRLQDEERQGLEFIVPCECSGSMGFVHQKCIKTWIQKQMEHTTQKIAHCEICKAEIFFKIGKSKHCDLRLRNLRLISGCNIVSSLVELFLLVVVIMVFRYSINLGGSLMLTEVMIVLICILGLAFGLTFVMMLGQAFVKSTKYISKIYSFEESVDIGLREGKWKSARHILSRNVIKMTTNQKPTRTFLHLRQGNLPFNQINPSNPTPQPVFEQFI